MNDTQKSAWGGNLISRRRMLHYGLAGMAGIAGGFWPVAAFGETQIMSGIHTGNRSIFTISTQKGDIYFTDETLIVIRKNLLEMLKQQEFSDDYAYFISEIETGNAQLLIFADSAHIGRWKIIHRNEKFALETQQVQVNNPIRLIYTAPFEWQDGQWKVLSVYIKTVKSR